MNHINLLQRIKRKAFLKLKERNKIEATFDKETLEQLGIRLYEFYEAIHGLCEENFLQRVFGSSVEVSAHEILDVIDTLDLILSSDTGFGYLANLTKK